jgi:FkbM family methyltransferase
MRIHGIKNVLRFLSPFGLVELHRRRFRLQCLGIPANRYSAAESDRASRFCRFELWPPELRHAPYNWVLVDVGANVGDYVAAVLKLISPERVIAIEPLPSCHSQLSSLLASNCNNILIKAAAGEVEGEIEMYFTGDSKMSSVLLPLAGIANAYHPGDYATRQMLKVPLVRIDNVVPANSAVGLLKLDVQGFEMVALRGAEETLKRTKAVQGEINYTPHYEGAASFDDVHDFLVARGFQLYGVSAPYFGNGRPLWADAMYCKIG